MPNQDIQVSGRAASLHSAIVSPNLKARRVLCESPFEYVSLWLKRENKKDALFYWEQARNFYDASLTLNNLSSPLTHYYCFLNATKALLTAKGIEHDETHGVAGWSVGSKKSLDNEKIKFKGKGVLPALCVYLGESQNINEVFTVKDLLRHIPFIHRAYCLSYKNSTELFLPLQNCKFVRKSKSSEAWFMATVEPQYVNRTLKECIKPKFSYYNNNGAHEITYRKRFSWNGNDLTKSLIELEGNHARLRQRISPIFASANRWYLKKNVVGSDAITNSLLVIMLAVMHRLSELSRYSPIELSGHFNVNHNWLLTEFIKSAPNQFIYGIASEITGFEFIKPDAF